MVCVFVFFVRAAAAASVAAAAAVAAAAVAVAAAVAAVAAAAAVAVDAAAEQLKHTCSSASTDKKSREGDRGAQSCSSSRLTSTGCADCSAEGSCTCKETAANKEETL